jgi:hypothetical protein
MPQSIVGDYFWYNISVIKVGNPLLNYTDLTVSVFDPNDNLLSSRAYSVILSPNQSDYMYPNYILNIHDIFSLDLQGTYKIVLSTLKPSLIFRFYYPSCRYVYYSNSFNYSFDVEPSWQYQNQQNLYQTEQNLYQTQQSLLEEQIKSQTSNENLSSKTINLTVEIEDLTVIMTILSFFTLLAVVYKGVINNKNKFIGIEGLVITVFLAFVFLYNLSFSNINTIAIIFDVGMIAFLILLSIGSINILKSKISKLSSAFALIVISGANVVLLIFAIQFYFTNRVISIITALSSLFFLIVIFLKGKDINKVKTAPGVAE